MIQRKVTIGDGILIFGDCNHFDVACKRIVDAYNGTALLDGPVQVNHAPGLLAESEP